jgi:hypothetical protein
MGFGPDKPEEVSDLKKTPQSPANCEVEKNWTKRSLSMWQREKAQEMLWMNR